MTIFIEDPYIKPEYDDWYEIEGVRKIKELSRQLRTFFSYKAELIRYRFRSSLKPTQNCTIAKFFNQKKDDEFIAILKKLKKPTQTLEEGIRSLLFYDDKTHFRKLSDITEKLSIQLHYFSEESLHNRPKFFKFIGKLAESIYMVKKCLYAQFNINSQSNSALKEFKNYQPMSFKNINLNDIKEAIKKINWKEISNEWSVIKHFNQFKNEIINLNPYMNCDKNNPLYMHKEWFSRIYNDPEFNLTDSKKGKICGISKDTVRYWREKVHHISGKNEWGQKVIVDKSDGRIWVRVPENYENPVVQKEDHNRRIMLEHRYVMERFLAQHPEWDISREFLNEGKYLKSECEIHHINLDYQDNRISNLWVFKNKESHQEARETLYNLVSDLLISKIVIFKKGKYSINF
ncbi:MAG: HNH endonuclease [Promethearchaeota archaeon]|jgi:hypothetical protein